MTCSEQSGGFLVLVGLAFLVGATLELRVHVEPDCWTEIDYEYVGRDAEGRPEWDYTERERCYE